MLSKKIPNIVPSTTIVTDENTNCKEQLCHSTINKVLNYTDFVFTLGNMDIWPYLKYPYFYVPATKYGLRI